jgi:hypothetical protein
VFFDSQGKSSVAWTSRLEVVRHRMHNISHISKLSVFGRAFAANAYALSTLLYAAQYAGQLPAEVMEKLRLWSAALIDAGLGPDDDLRRPPGIPWDCMAAHPRCGGFGLLPVHHHLLSRWACEALPFCRVARLLGWPWHMRCGASGLPQSSPALRQQSAAPGACSCVVASIYSPLPQLMRVFLQYCGC